MNKKDLIARTAKKVDKSFKETEAVVNGLFESVVEALLEEESIVILGFGSFSVRKLPTRMGYNPYAKTAMQIPARHCVKFKPGGKLASGKYNKKLKK